MDRETRFSQLSGEENAQIDDDGRPKRKGTLVTASAHIITSVIGSGVLSLPWAIAQLGWIIGPLALIMFALITLFASTLLADSYRSPDPITGRRNYIYMDVVKANLGGRNIQLSGIAQYVNLIGFTVGYTITTSISMAAIKRSYCFHKHGHSVGCHTSNNPFMIIFGIIQIFISQIPNFHELSLLSLITTTMCFLHASIGLGLSIAKVMEASIPVYTKTDLTCKDDILEGGPHVQTSLIGVPIGKEMSRMDKTWSTFTALGNLAFAYAFSDVLIEIQDTLRSGPPENKVMKKAAFTGISVSTFFYMLCGLVGYAALGNNAPGNLLAGFGFFEPFWLIDVANLCVVIHLIGAFQICAQPVFAFVESWTRQKWPNARLINKEYLISLPNHGHFRFTFFRMIWRTIYVIVTTILAMSLPFFNDFVGLLGAASFWPLTVYFPIKMHIARKNIHKPSLRWFWMQTLSVICLITSVAAAVGSVGSIVKSLQTFKFFQSVS